MINLIEYANIMCYRWGQQIPSLPPSSLNAIRCYFYTHHLLSPFTYGPQLYFLFTKYLSLGRQSISLMSHTQQLQESIGYISSMRIELGIKKRDRKHLQQIEVQCCLFCQVDFQFQEGMTVLLPQAGISCDPVLEEHAVVRVLVQLTRFKRKLC